MAQNTRKSAEMEEEILLRCTENHDSSNSTAAVNVKQI